MKNTVKLSLVLFIIIYFFLSLIPASLQAQNDSSIPLNVPIKNTIWTSSGILSFNFDSQKQQPYLDWKPTKKESFLQCSLPFRNLRLYNCIIIEAEQKSNTRAWFFLYLHDGQRQFAISYFQLEGAGPFKLELSIQSLFSSFSNSSAFNWSDVRSLSFLSHPNADLNIAEAHLRIFNIQFLKEDKPLFNHDIIVPSIDMNPLFFNQNHAETLTSLAEKNQHELYRNAIQRINQHFNQVQLQDCPPLESLRDSALFCRYFHPDPDFIDHILQKTLFYNKNYWRKLHDKNDILVQEEALSFIQIFDLLKENILNHSQYSIFFSTTLKYIAMMEKESCFYWTQLYPYGQGNNHVTRAACILGIIALIYPQDDILRQEWLDFSLIVLNYYFHFQISIDGVLNEGTHYYAYLMETLSYFAYYLKNASGKNLFYDFAFSIRLRNLVQWSHQIETPEGYLPCIDDSWPTGVTFPKKFLQDFFCPQEKGYHWHHNTQPWNLFKGSYFPLFLVNIDHILENSYEEESLLPEHQEFLSDSQVVLRQNNIHDSQYLFLAGKNMFSLHEHDSSGSFQYYYNQKPVITLNGYGPEGWTSKHRSYYVSGAAHNVMTINGAGPKGFYNGGIGPIDQSELKSFICANKTAYAHLTIFWDVHHPDVFHQRHIILMPANEKMNTCMILFDQIRSSSAKHFQVNLHPFGSFIDHQMQNTYFLPAEPVSDHIIKIQQISNWQKRIKKGYHSTYWGHETPTEYLQYFCENKQELFGAIIQSIPKFSEPILRTTIEPIPSGEIVVISSDQDNFNKKDIFMLNPYQTIQQSKQIGSNANFLHLRYNHKHMKTEHCYISNGAYANYEKMGIFYASHRLSLSLEWQEQEHAYDFVFDAPHANTRIFFYFSDVSQILMEGKDYPFKIHQDKISMNLPQGKNSMIIKCVKGSN